MSLFSVSLWIFAAEFSYFEMEMKFFAVVIDLSGSFLDC